MKINLEPVGWACFALALAWIIVTYTNNNHEIEMQKLNARDRIEQALTNKQAQ